MENKHESIDGIPAELSSGLNSLAWNGNPLELLNYKVTINKENPSFNLSQNHERNVYSVIHNSINRIEEDLDYKTAIFFIQLLVDCGLLKKEKFIKYVDKYVQDSMQNHVNKNYSQEFLAEFKNDLINKINF